MNNENLNMENKREYTDEIAKEIIAFANTTGGVVCIGVDNEGGKYPIANPDVTLTQATNSIRDSILPDVTMFTKAYIDGDIIKIVVSEGTNKPYYLKGKGLKPSGVFVRQGNSKAPASNEQIRMMIKITDGDSFELERSLEQDLTFKALENEFEERGVALKLQNLGLVNDGVYSNLGLILSDQCKHSIKVARFIGTDKMEFKNRKEFTGSIIMELHKTFDFLELLNELPAKIVGLVRKERYDYPPEALREALLNAVIHRDYAYSGSIIVNMYDDRVEFVSLGGLFGGITKADILAGVSQPRNEKLANVFYRLKHIEAYGTGIARIFKLYNECSEKPAINVTDNAFVLELPNMNYFAKVDAAIKPQHKEILKFIDKNGGISRQHIQEILGV